MPERMATFEAYEAAIAVLVAYEEQHDPERARLLRGADEVRGDFMIYELQSEVFRVVGGGKAAASGNNPDGRVRAVIQPKPREDAGQGTTVDKSRPTPPPLRIKPSPSIANPRE